MLRDEPAIGLCSLPSTAHCLAIIAPDADCADPSVGELNGNSDLPISSSAWGPVNCPAKEFGPLTLVLKVPEKIWLPAPKLVLLNVSASRSYRFSASRYGLSVPEKNPCRSRN